MLDPLEGLRSDGTIVTGADRSRVPVAFEAALAACTAAVADPRVSLHVYGSVATGVARVGTSDIDLFAVGLPATTARAIQARLSQRFRHLARAVEISVVQPDDLVGEDDQPYGNRAFLKHYCVHLAGPDRRAGLPRAAADARTARGFNGDIGRRYLIWRAALREGTEGTPDAAALGRRVARKTLLAVAGLVSIYDVTWTTDRVGAAYRWAQVVPATGPSLTRLVQWSEGSVPASMSELRHTLAAGGIVEQVVEQFRETIGLWT